MRREDYSNCRVCLCVSLMERLFILKILSCTQWARKVKKFVGFSLKPLCCRDPALPPLYSRAYSRPFFCKKHACTLLTLSVHAQQQGLYHFMKEQLSYKQMYIFSGMVASECQNIWGIYLKRLCSRDKSRHTSKKVNVIITYP